MARDCGCSGLWDGAPVHLAARKAPAMLLAPRKRRLAEGATCRRFLADSRTLVQGGLGNNSWPLLFPLYIRLNDSVQPSSSNTRPRPGAEGAARPRGDSLPRPRPGPAPAHPPLGRDMLERSGAERSGPRCGGRGLRTCPGSGVRPRGGQLEAAVRGRGQINIASPPAGTASPLASPREGAWRRAAAPCWPAGVVQAAGCEAGVAPAPARPGDGAKRGGPPAPVPHLARATTPGMRPCAWQPPHVAQVLPRRARVRGSSGIQRATLLPGWEGTSVGHGGSPDTARLHA